ncbi:MAG: PDZ domain-containing protein, partial [Dehalococcoidia bacterium]|nr:PDZ domain-containing protein [Dehalococcoidia bacterium]
MFGLPLPSWLLIIPVLAFLIFVHELGHYLAAKRFGIKVLEFGFGFPPRMFGVRYGETLYSINWIPLGGFVRMLGEDNATGVPDSAEQARLESGDPDPDRGRRFTDQSPLKRTIVLVAGSFMNFLTPLVIFSIIFLFPRDVPVGTVSISGVAPRSPAAEAGIRPGDQILAVNGDRVRNHHELIERVGDSLGEEIELNLRRGSIVSGLGQSPEFSVVETVTVVPRSNPPSFRVVESVTDPGT